MPASAAWLSMQVAEAGRRPILLPTAQTTVLVACRACAAIAVLLGAIAAAMASTIDKVPDAYGDVAIACVLALGSVCFWFSTGANVCALRLTQDGFVYRRFFHTLSMGWRQVSNVQPGPDNRYGLPVVLVDGGRKPIRVAGVFDVGSDDLAGAMNTLRQRAAG